MIPLHRRLLLAALLLGTPPAGAIPITVSVDLCRGCPAPGGVEARVILEPTGAAGLQPLSRVLRVPGTARFDAPEGAAWEASAEVSGYWSQPAPAGPGEEPGRSARLELWPAGRVTGELQLAPGSSPPAALTVRFQPAPGGAGNLPRGAATCPVSARRFRCELPAGELDLRLRARGFVTQYRWGTRIPARGGLDVGTVELKPGASIVGWVEAPGREVRLEECKVEVEPQAAGRASSVEADERRGWLRLQGKVSARGFFEVSGMAPGAYRVTVRHSRLAPATVGPVGVVDGSETELRPIQLYPQAALEVRLAPPRDPYGSAWTVALTREGSEPGHEEEVGRAAASAEGVWRAAELTPGPYTLRVEGSHRSRWAHRPVEVEPEMAPLQVELPVVHVEGEIRLGKEPLEALVWFGGRHGARRVAARSDEEGRFAVDLPGQEEPWNVELENEPRGISAKLFEVVVRKSAGQRAARVRLQVPDTALTGRVVDEAGRPVSGAWVEAFGEPSLNRASTRSAGGEGAEAGGFTLRGLSPGAWQLVVEAPDTGAGLSSEPLAVELAEGSPVAGLRLVLRRRLTLAGHVSGPGGQPVAGAEVLASPELESGAFAGWLPHVTTDPGGNFTLRVPGDSTGAVLTLFAPGFAVKQLRVDPRRSEPLVLAVDATGGTLVISYEEHVEDALQPWSLVRRLETRIFHENPIDARDLVNWAHLHGIEQSDPDRFVIPLLEPGRYTVCRPPRAGPDAARAAGKAPAPGPSCVSGELAPHGELVLRLPKAG